MHKRFGFRLLVINRQWRIAASRIKKMIKIKLQSWALNYKMNINLVNSFFLNCKFGH